MMGAQLRAIVGIMTVLLCLSPAYAKQDHLPFFAKSESEISNYFEAGRLQKIDFNGDELLTVAHDIGSGLHILILYIYTGSDTDGWSLLAYHRSFASEINFRIDQDANEFVALSRSGRVLLRLPYESLHGDHLDQLKPAR